MKNKNGLVEIQMVRASNDRVYLEVTCEKSRERFLQLDLSLAEFGFLVTGRGLQDIPATVKGLDRVNKTRIMQTRTAFRPYCHTQDLSHEDWLREHCQEDGWEIDYYLGSQSSVQHVYANKSDYGMDGHNLNYRVFKYIEDEK